MLDKFELLQSTVLIWTGYQKGEGYAKNIPALWQAQQIYKFNILLITGSKIVGFHLAPSMLSISLNSITIVLLTILNSLTTLVTDYFILVY